MNLLILKKKLNRNIFLYVLSFFLLLTLQINAADYYATPSGAGSQNGSSWSNAIPGSNIENFINNSMGPGDRLLIDDNGGSFTNLQMTITNSGTSGNRITIEGVNDPLFKGPGTGSGIWMKLDNAASYLHIKNIKVEDYQYVMRSVDAINNPYQHNIIEGLRVHQVYHGIYLTDYRYSEIKNCILTRVRGRGISFRDGCRHVQVFDCLVDHNLGDVDYGKTNFSIGFEVRNANGRYGSDPDDIIDIVFTRCEARNSLRIDNNYTNGDGFTVNAAWKDIKFYNCIAHNNADGGWDDKGYNTYYENCISVGNGNNYRPRNNQKYVNCLSANATVVELSNHGNRVMKFSDASSPQVEVYHCTFHAGIFQDSDNQQQPKWAEDCLISDVANAADFINNSDRGTGNVFDDTPGYKNPSSDYNPTYFYDFLSNYYSNLTTSLDNYDNNDYPNKGYKYVAPGDPPVISNLSANPTSGDAPMDVQFNVTADDPDGDNANMSYDWDFGDGGSSTAEDPAYTYDTPGNYTATVTVTDEDMQTTSDNITISVTGNYPPEVSFTFPQNKQRFVANAVVDIEVSASDQDGDIDKVEFYDGTTLLATDNSAPFEHTINGLSAGDHTIEARAYDNEGATGSSNILVYSQSVSAVDIAVTSSVPVIDGSVDALWDNQTEHSVDNVLNGTVNGSSDLSATWKAVWDASNLYVIIDVTDDSKTNDSGDDFWKDDGVELYIDMNYDHLTYYEQDDYQLVVRYNDNTLYGDNSSGLNITYAQADKSDGYRVEFMLPWTELSGYTTQSDLLLGIDVGINDDDDGLERDKKIAWNTTTDNAHNDPSLFGAGKLTGDVTYYTISASAGTGGSIDPSGDVSVVEGNNQSFTISANTNYEIADVTVDGSSVGAVTSYEFTNVTADHTIAASFNAVEDSTAPAAPTNLSATGGDASLSLNWDDNSESDLAGYNVYRSITSGSGYSQINSSLVSSSDYTDDNVTNGTTYYYVVTTVDNSANESGYSGEVEATPQSSGGQGTETLSADADAKVRGKSHADDPLGTEGYLTAKDCSDNDYDRHSYIRFDLSGYTNSVNSATLRLKVSNNAGIDGLVFKEVSDDSWDEATITWNNAPAPGNTIGTETSLPSADNWLEVDVTSQVNNEISGDGLITIYFESQNSDCQGISFYSKENGISANDPQLVVDSDGGGDTDPPASPVNLSATGNDGSVSLNWDDNSESDLAGYNVYRSTTSGSGYSQINGSLVSSSDYTDNSVTNGTTYYYVVTAEDNSANESGYSVEASATPQDVTAPAAPVNLSATGNDGSVSLNWDDNSESDLAGYNVYRSTTSGSGYSQINGSLVSNSDYTDNSVTNGTTYYYVVTAEDNSANESGYSSEASAIPQAATNLVAHYPFNGNTDDIANANNGTISGDPQYVTGEDGQGLDFDGNGDYVDVSANSDIGVTQFTISAWINAGSINTGNWQAIIEHDRSGDNWYGLFGDPNENKFHFRWSSSSAADFSSTITTNTWYHVVGTYDGSTAKMYLNGSLDNSVSSSAAVTATTAGLRVGMNMDGNEPFDGTVDDIRIYNEALSETEVADLYNSYSDTDIDPPAAPANLSATGNDGSVSLNWDDNSESDLAGYNVYRSTTSGSGYGQINSSLVSSSDYTDNSVTNDTTYYYVVTAEDNSANESGYSNEGSATPIGSGTETLSADADAYVTGGSNAGNSYGTLGELVTKDCSNDSYDRHSYIRFDLSGYSNSVNSATLRLKVNSNAGIDGVVFKEVSDDSWDESTINWNNAPLAGNTISTITSLPSAGDWLELDVTSQVNSEISGDGLISIYFESQNRDCKGIVFYSKENGTSANDPQLYVDYGSTKSGSITVARDDNEFNALSVFPNPADEQVIIQVSADKYDIRIYDVNGNLKKIQRNVSGSKIIQTNEIGTAGVYFIKILMDDEVLIKKLILK